MPHDSFGETWDGVPFVWWAVWVWGRALTVWNGSFEHDSFVWSLEVAGQTFASGAFVGFRHSLVAAILSGSSWFSADVSRWWDRYQQSFSSSGWSFCCFVTGCWSSGHHGSLQVGHGWWSENRWPLVEGWPLVQCHDEACCTTSRSCNWYPTATVGIEDWEEYHVPVGPRRWCWHATGCFCGWCPCQCFGDTSQFFGVQASSIRR